MSKQVIGESLIDNKENIAKVKGRVDENPEDPYVQHEITTPFLIDNKENIAKVKGRVDENPK